MIDNITYSPLYFCNSALLGLGSNGLASLDDNKLEANIAKQLYPLVLGALATRHRWRFLLKENLPLPLVITKNATWQNLYPDYQQYQLPANLLLLLTPLGDKNHDNIMADGILLSKRPAPRIDCLLQISEEFFPIYFAKLLVAFLMAEMALPITEDITRADFLIRKANQEFKEARAQDAALTAVKPITARFVLTEKR